ncbi:MAG: hypothetical protein MR009_00470 [Sutterellaceae bacterium]|nr:hypothetical protein [Sutterellaceae bacterium]MDD7441973.1 hypothetical protein [Sutterellaceae bacterium]MDY2867809.1 hypothetical protein [Mesosutterella sp.]
MSTAYYLLPGARLPEAVAREVIGGTGRDALERIASGLENVSVEQLASGITAPFALCPHHLWFWDIVPRGKTTPAHAAYSWLEDNGPTLGTEIWEVTPCRVSGGKFLGLGEDPLTNSEVDACSPFLRKALARNGFVLQQWDNRWYATRMKDWPVVARPWECEEGRGLDEEALAGDRATAERVMKEAGEALRAAPPVAERRASGRPAPDTVWISGGGRQIRFYPPTLIRAVLSDEPVIRGWAKESGILCQYVGRTSDGTWPREAPPGDVIAVVSDLWKPWLRRDWEAWLHALPGAAEKVERLRKGAEERESGEAVVVCFGRGNSATLTRRTGGLRRRFLGRFGKKAAPGLDWLIDKEGRQ